MSLGAFPNLVQDIFLSPLPLECAVGQLSTCPGEGCSLNLGGQILGPHPTFQAPLQRGPDEAVREDSLPAWLSHKPPTQGGQWRRHRSKAHSSSLPLIFEDCSQRRGRGDGEAGKNLGPRAFSLLELMLGDFSLQRPQEQLL